MKAIRDAAAECLRLAMLPELQDGAAFILVQLPRSLKVGCNFHLRLAEAAEQLACGRCYRVWTPLAVPGPHRSYILRWGRWEKAGVGAFIRGIAEALTKFGFMNQAKIFIADSEDQVLRQVHFPLFTRRGT